MKSEKMIVGLPGLETINPRIDWRKGDVSLNHLNPATVGAVSSSNSTPNLEEERLESKLDLAREREVLELEKEKLRLERKEFDLEKKGLELDQKSRDLDQTVREINEISVQKKRKQARKKENKSEVEGKEVAREEMESDPDLEIISRQQLRRLIKKERPKEMLFVNLYQILNEVQIAATKRGESDLEEDERFRRAGERIMADYPDVFSSELPDGEAPDRGVEHGIEEKEGSSPVRARPYRHSEKQRDYLRITIEKLVKSGKMVPSCSEYASPIILIPKGDGYRVCVDYRALNSQTIKDSYPLPRAEDLMDQFNRAKIYSKVDMTSGYYQIGVKKEDRKKTAIVTDFGLFEYTVMPFGLTNAPATFQRLMNSILRDFLGKFVVVYLDDILIFSNSEEEHKEHLKLVMEALRKAKMILSPKKCELFTRKTTFLGFKVSEKGLEMEEEKVEAVRNWPRCKNIKEILGFLGTVTFYERFIHRYAQLAEPLTRLLKKGAEWSWSQEQDEAFEKIKLAITSKPVLKLFRRELETRVFTDACGVSVGCHLEQRHPDGWRPVAFSAKKFDQTQVRWPVREKELYAVVHALRKWRIYLEDLDTFDLFTDHHSLQYFLTQSSLSEKEARWQQEICNFKFNIRYIKGELNRADGISRKPYQDRWEASVAAVVSGVGSDLVEKIRLASKNCPEMKLFEDGAVGGTLKGMVVEEGLIIRKKGEEKRVFVPTEELRAEVLAAYHDSPIGGHFGQDRTLLLTKAYFWPRMESSIRAYVNSCPQCQRIKVRSSKSQGLLHPLPPATAPGQSLSMDFITDLPETEKGFTAIMLVCDRFSKLVRLIPTNMSNLTAPATARLFVDHIVSQNGIPESLVSDRDPRFTSEFWKSLAAILNVKLLMSSAAHPQTDGQSERQIRTVEQVLRPYCSLDQNDWDVHLPMVEFAMNNAPSATTGLSPFFVEKGRHPRHPAHPFPTVPAPAAEEFATQLKEIHSQVSKQMEKSIARYKSNADVHRRDVKFEVGDEVLLDLKNIKSVRPCKKLDWLRAGPYRITKVINPVAFELNTPEGIHPVFHASLLSKYIDPQSFIGRKQVGLAPDIIEGEEFFEVEKIVGRRGSKGRRQYLVKWKGYGDWDCSWEPERNLGMARDAVREFENLEKEKRR